MRIISAADANRYFSRIMHEVAQGEPVVVTSRGRPLVRIVPAKETARADADRTDTARRKAWRDHFERLRKQLPLNGGRITRDEIYDD